MESISLNNSILCGNSATVFSTLSAYGGAFMPEHVEELNIMNVIFQENASDANGGA